MKRIALSILALFVFAGMAIGIDQVYLTNKGAQIVNPGQLHTNRGAWATFDSATASAGDEPNDLAVGERTYALASAAAEGGDSKILFLTLFSPERQNWNRLAFRCTGITNDQQIIYQMYKGTLGSAAGTDCALVKVAQLTFTVGQQVSLTATYEYADTLAVTKYHGREWLVSSPASDLLAEGDVDIGNADVIVMVPTTVPCNCILEVSGY